MSHFVFTSTIQRMARIRAALQREMRRPQKGLRMMRLNALQLTLQKRLIAHLIAQPALLQPAYANAAWPAPHAVHCR